MADVEFKVTKDNTQEVIRRMEMSLPAALELCGQLAEKYAKMLSPVDTGRLRNSITHATNSYSGAGTYKDNEGNTFTDATARETPDEHEVVIGTNVEYATRQEYGEYTHKVGVSPYLRPAMADHVDEYREIFINALRNT